MSERGIEVGEALRGFRGILTGVPVYLEHTSLAAGTGVR
jgi:hypothetical protein